MELTYSDPKPLILLHYSLVGKTYSPTKMQGQIDDLFRLSTFNQKDFLPSFGNYAAKLRDIMKTSKRASDQFEKRKTLEFASWLYFNENATKNEKKNEFEKIFNRREYPEYIFEKIPDRMISPLFSLCPQLELNSSEKNEPFEIVVREIFLKITREEPKSFGLDISNKVIMKSFSFTLFQIYCVLINAELTGYYDYKNPLMLSERIKCWSVNSVTESFLRDAIVNSNLFGFHKQSDLLKNVLVELKY